MELTQKSAADVTIVSLAGRLDVRTSPQFSTRLAEMLIAEQPRVVLEASGLSYLSSAGCRALLVAAKAASSRGGKLVLCSMTVPVRRVVEIAGLEEVFETYPSREEALASLATA